MGDICRALREAGYLLTREFNSFGQITRLVAVKRDA